MSLTVKHSAGRESRTEMTAPKPRQKREARKLKPCPFCGSRLAVIRSNGIGDFFVICGDSSDDENGCGARTSDVRCEGEEYAAERWNRRKP